MIKSITKRISDAGIMFGGILDMVLEELVKGATKGIR